MQVIECPPTPLALPAGATVQVRTLRWVLPEWPGKQLRQQGWHGGVW